MHSFGAIFAAAPQTQVAFAQTVYVVDDDAGVRKSTNLLFRSLGLGHRPYINGSDFLADVADLEPGCVLLDIRMPLVSGLDVLAELEAANLQVRFPVIVITGQGDIETAVKAMKLGAIDFLEKPFSEDVLLAALAHGNDIIRTSRDTEKSLDLAMIAKQLTRRQMEVLRGMVEGLSNKGIAALLGIAPRTVEMHRANLMAALGAKRLADVLHKTLGLGLKPLGPSDIDQ